MIQDIKELNFPEYATLSHAECLAPDMEEKTITTQVEIDGMITPDFSYDWAMEFQGEKYIMPLRQPHGTKEDKTILSVIDLTFQHWAAYQLKRWYFFTVQPIESGTVVPDKYIASVNLNLKDFCDLFRQILNYHYGDAIGIDLNPEWEYSSEPVKIEINHSYIWDVLIKIHDLYAVRWQIVPHPDNDNLSVGGERYVIKVGYPTTEIAHIFEHGFKGGLLKVERQVQDEDIRNMIIGRGGSKNLPLRYFKQHDENNANFSPDPDWIPELANIPFTELHGATFRSYIQGWKTKHYGSASVISAEEAYAPWAWEKGYTDSTFDPVEYVADEILTEAGEGDRYVEISPEYSPAVKGGSSIDKYGPMIGGLENNDEIYPTIQGITVDGLGRIDEAVAVQPIESDDIAEAAENDAQKMNVGGASSTLRLVANERKRMVFDGVQFEVPSGQNANFDEGEKAITLTKDGVRIVAQLIRGRWTFTPQTYKITVETESVEIENAIVEVVNEKTGEERSASGIPEGLYHYRVTLDLHNTGTQTLNVTVACESPTLTIATLDEQWSNTWDIWVKNLWGTEKSTGETDEQYAERVWSHILGDREGNEAKIVFSDGPLSTSEDYEFTIVKGGVHYDPSKSISIKDKDGNVTATYPSHWRITLAKSDADLESLGVYVPSTKRQAQAGNHFFFIGIDMPHKYVLWAEKKLDDWKKDELRKVKDVKPTWVVGLDKVRIHNHGKADALIDCLRPGNTFTLFDRRFIPGAAQEKLYIQSVTYTYNEPTDKEANLLPDVEIVLSDRYTTSANPVATLSSDVNAIQRQLGSLSNIEQVVRAIGDKLYLRKDGMPDRSMSPTEFMSLLTSASFRNGIIGGQGWGFFKDEDGKWVLETDKVNIRQSLQVNNLVINQVQSRGGMTVESAAALEIDRVSDTAEGYLCYFDQKEGTVANLFVVDDVAYCSRMTADNGALKFYKRRVVAASDNSVTLSKTDVNGDGIPETGDIILQYGNYTDSGRQYVIVRDVINGGYERFIEGLDSVTADGKEYYFAGRLAGSTPRWFVGDANGPYLEYLNGVFNLNKVRLSVTSTIGDKSFEELINSADAIDYLKKALPQSTLIEGGLILSSLLQLGYIGYDGLYNVLSGLNGIPSGSSKGNGLAFWAGGRMIDKAEDPDNGATTAIRMDGSAYYANGAITMDDTGLQAGENVRLDHAGLHLIVNGEECATITNREIDTSQYLRNLFNETIETNWERIDISLSEYTVSAVQPITTASETGTNTGSVTDLIPVEPITPGDPNPTPIPDRKVVIVKNEISKTIWSGVNSDILTFSLQVNLQLQFYGVVTERSFIGNAVIDILNENNVVASFSSKFLETQSLPKKAEAIISIPEYKCPNLGNYSVRLRIPKGESAVVNPDDSLMSAYATISGGGSAFFGATPGKVIGRNGIAFCRGNCIIAQDDDTILLRVGKCAFHVTESGIKKTLNGGETWSDV